MFKGAIVVSAVLALLCCAADAQFRWHCRSTHIRQYVHDALVTHQHTGNTEAMAKQIINDLEQSFPGTWIALASSLPQYFYIDFSGPDPGVRSSNAYCGVQTDKWIVKVVKVDY